MNDSSTPVVFLSGAGGGAPDLSVFRMKAGDATRFETISYPGWRRYVADGFSADSLIADLAEEVVKRVPDGPIAIVGLSIGGHFGYAIGLLLKQKGREIAGLCVVDSFMATSSVPSAGWKGRALEQGFELLRKRRMGEFARFVRSKFWRLLVRLAGNGLPVLAQRFYSRWSPSISSLDPVFEEELSMRLLVREIAPWIAKLNEKPVALDAPAALLRTRMTAAADDAWQRRCPNIKIFEISGQHHNLFEPENIGSLREAFVTATRDWH